MQQRAADRRAGPRRRSRSGGGLRVDVLVEAAHQHPRGGEPERDVHEEDPAPARCTPRTRRPASGRRPTTIAPHAGDVALHLGPLRDRVDVADDRHRRSAGSRPRRDPGPAGTRSAPACSTRTRTAPSRARNSPMPSSMIGLRPTQVGELAVDRHRDRLGQQVDREQPRELGEPAEVVDDDGTAVARMVASIATSPTLSITASRIGPRSDRSPTLARSIRSVVISVANVCDLTTIPRVQAQLVDQCRGGRGPRRTPSGGRGQAITCPAHHCPCQVPG